MEDRIPRGLQHRHETCCEKGGRHERQACRVQRWHHCGDVVFQTGGLVYDKYLICDTFAQDNKGYTTDTPSIF